MRFRIDGMLAIIMTAPLKLQGQITSRIKMLLKLDKQSSLP